MKTNLSWKGILLLAFLLVSLPTVVNAYGDPDDSGSWDEDPEGVPIDGGISILLAAGAGYGVKKVYELKNRKK